MVGIAIFIFPFNMQKKLANLRYFSFMILLIVFFTIFVSFAEVPEYYAKFKDSTDYTISWWIAPFEMRWVQGMSTILLSYNCQITFFYVRGEMRHKTRTRIKKVIRNLIFIECLFYLLISVAGYISLGDKMIPAVYTLRRKLSNLHIHSSS